MLAVKTEQGNGDMEVRSRNSTGPDQICYVRLSIWRQARPEVDEANLVAHSEGIIDS
jgi:hypothetical protein